MVKKKKVRNLLLKSAFRGISKYLEVKLALLMYIFSFHWQLPSTILKQKEFMGIIESHPLRKI